MTILLLFLLPCTSWRPAFHSTHRYAFIKIHLEMHISESSRNAGKREKENEEWSFLFFFSSSLHFVETSVSIDLQVCINQGYSRNANTRTPRNAGGRKKKNITKEKKKTLGKISKKNRLKFDSDIFPDWNNVWIPDLYFTILTTPIMVFHFATRSGCGNMQFHFPWGSRSRTGNKSHRQGTVC